MDTLQIIILALVQALTEFLPVSSSAHLVLVGYFLGWDYQGLAFDLAVHVGTLLAVLVYFRRDIGELVAATLAWRPGRALDDRQRLAFGLALATLPAAAAGLALGDAGAMALRAPWIMGSTLIGFGLLLAYVAWRAPAPRDGEGELPAERLFAGMGFGRALFVGCAQALALIPGTSRSGISMTAAMALGLSRVAAARYAFLLSAPIMVLAGAHAARELLLSDEAVRWGDFALGLGVSAVAGVLVIHFFLGMMRRIGIMPFVVYRMLLGLAVLATAYWLR